MKDEDRLDRKVPAIDMHVVEAFSRVVRWGFDKREVADRFFHWGTVMLRVFDGADEITQRLSDERRNIVVDEMIANAVESANRKNG